MRLKPDDMFEYLVFLALCVSTVIFALVGLLLLLGENQPCGGPFSECLAQTVVVAASTEAGIQSNLTTALEISIPG